MAISRDTTDMLMKLENVKMVNEEPSNYLLLTIIVFRFNFDASWCGAMNAKFKMLIVLCRRLEFE